MAKEIGISEFKEHCLKLIEDFNNNGQSLTITKRGKAIATVTPVNEKIVDHNFFGLLKSKAFIKSDIVNPVEEKWHAESN